MIKIRPAQLEDIPAIIELLHDDPQGSVRESLLMNARSAYLTAFHEITNDPNCWLFIATEAGHIVGCVQINVLSGLSYQGSRRAIIEDVRIAQSHRGKGYGKMLIDAVSAHAISQGCKMIEFFVHKDRSDTHRFYEACGFMSSHKGYRKQL